MSRRGRVILVASDSDEDPFEYYREVSSSEEERPASHGRSSPTLSSVSSLATSTVTTSTEAPTAPVDLAGADDRNNDDNLNALFEEMSLRHPHDRTLYSIKSGSGERLTAQW